MIDTVHEELSINSGVQLAITFVVQQSDVFDVFKAKLKSASSTRSPSPSRLPTQERSYYSSFNHFIFYFIFYFRS